MECVLDAVVAIGGDEGSESYATPALYGMDKLRAINCYIGCRRNVMHIAPQDLESEMSSPKAL